MAQRAPQGAEELVAQAWSTVEEVLGEVLGGLLDGMLPGLHRRTSMRMYSEIYDAVNQPREGAWVAEQLYSNLSLWLNDFVPRRIAATLVDLCRSGQELKLCRTVIEYYNKYRTFSRFFCIVFNYVNKAYPPQGTSLEAMFHDAFTRSVHKDVQRPLLTSVQEDWTTCDVGCTSWLARWLEDDAALELMDEAALELMRTAVQAHIVAEGRALIAAFESEVSTGPFSPETSIVTKLMELHAEFGQLIGQEFEESRELLTACKRSFARILTFQLTRKDSDPGAGEGAVKTRETSFPEVLAMYCEAVMKRETNARDADPELGELLSYMKENDVFSTYFIDIIKHPETGCGALLGDGKTSDLVRMHRLVKSVHLDAALELEVQARIEAEGRTLIASFESEVSTDPFSLETSIVTKLMELHAKFGHLIGHEFEESRELVVVCKRSFADVLTVQLTRNDPDPSAGEGAVKTRETSFPELLATYCEAVMKRETNAREPDQKLGELLSYMKENDVFSRRFIDIIKHPETGCGVLLGDGKTSDLGRMYRLVKYANHDAALELMRTEVQARIEAEGRTLIAGFESEVSTGPLSLETPFVTKVMGLSAKYGDLIKQLFEGSNLFHVNRKVGFTAFLKAKLTRRDPKHGHGALDTRETSFPEVLATYCDAVMRRVLKDVVGPTVEMEHLDELLTVFTYVTEKDVFQEYYKVKLSKRLLQTTPFEELEKAFLERLQREMGKSYTHKLEGMLLDLESSKNTLRTFKTDVASAGLGTDFNVNVLGAANWPAYKPDSMVPPAQLRRCVEAFQRWFTQQNATKKLTWIHVLGQATMSVSFPKGSKEVSASLYQASVLLTIDTMATATPKAVAEALRLDMKAVKHLIASMFVSKSYDVLRRVDASGETVITTDKPFGDDDLFALNRDFTFKTRKFKLVAPSASSAADVFTEPGIDERRRIHVDAAVVRIMKSRRTLSYTELEDLVITQLSKQFVPQPKLIKLRVDDLITREYLRRHDGDRNSLEYLA
jgi:hypothetical protein